MSSHTLINGLLAEAAHAIIPDEDEIQEQTKIVNEVSSEFCIFFFNFYC